MQKIKIPLFTILLSLSVPCLFAQQSFKYKAGLQKVDSNGFYKINLQPDLIAVCKGDLSDLRLTGKANRFFPYINSNQLPVRNQSHFVAFAHIINPTKIDTLSSYIIKISGSKGISELWLKLRNTAVKRTANLLGSDDLNNWYAIKENVELQEASLNGEGNYKQLLSFPSSTYQYIKIQVNDKNKTPINIIQAGKYFSGLSRPEYILLPKINFTEKDSGKVSYVTVQFPLPYQINKLHFDIGGTKFFNRQITVYHASGKSRELIVDTLLSSKGGQDLYLQTKAAKLEIEINNEDNPPLVVKRISAFEASKSIVAYLEKSQSYNLMFGDEKSQIPNYDLQSFTDSLPRQLPEINHTSVTQNPYYKNSYKNSYKKAGTIPKWIIWIAIIAALSVLTVLTLKMTKEVNKKSSVNEEG